MKDDLCFPKNDSYPLKKITYPDNSYITILVEKEATANILIKGSNLNIYASVREDSTLNFGFIQLEGENPHVEINIIGMGNSTSNISLLQINGTNFTLKETVILEGEGASSFNYGMIKAKNDEIMSMDLKMIHKVPNTTGDNLIQSVASDNSKVYFQGMLRIDPIAQKTNTYLQDNSLILGETAYNNSIPSLEILANDVKASHGATSGYIDENQLLYLQARGIPREEAKKMIIDAFFEPVISKIKIKKIMTTMRELLKN